MIKGTQLTGIFHACVRYTGALIPQNYKWLLLKKYITNFSVQWIKDINLATWNINWETSQLRSLWRNSHSSHILFFEMRWSLIFSSKAASISRHLNVLYKTHRHFWKWLMSFIAFLVAFLSSTTTYTYSLFWCVSLECSLTHILRVSPFINYITVDDEGFRV